ncbi:MAG: PEP-CTERM sorting domain-containing protein [Pirellula sp.]
MSSFDAPVPEPTSMAIFGLGALGMAFRAHRRRSS